MAKSVIAIDGPAGAGKSTIAKLAAKKLGYIYIDTGAMYRAAAWKVMQNGKKSDSSAVTENEIENAVKDIDVHLSYDADKNTVVTVNGINVTADIRTPEVTALVSKVAAVPKVREKMVELQRQMAEKGSVLMDGRDIGTCVLPNADLKIFLTATADERADRRAKEMKSKGYDVDVAKIKEDIIARDEADMKRSVSPLKQAEDAILLDTTDMTIDEVLQSIIRLAAD